MLIVAGGDPWRTAFSDSAGYAQTTRRIIVSLFTSGKQKIKIWSNSIKEVLRDLNDNSRPDAGFASKLFMHGSIWPLSIPAPSTSGTSLAPRDREWGIVWSGPVPGVVGWDKTIFSLILRSKCHFSPLENCHFSVAASPQESRPDTSTRIPPATQANKVCIWRCVFKFQANMRMMPTRMDFFFAKERIKRNISLISLALIIRQLK